MLIKNPGKLSCHLSVARPTESDEQDGSGTEL